MMTALSRGRQLLETKATYDKIRDWVGDNYQLHVTNLNIAQVKRKNGIELRENYNKPKSDDSRQPGITLEKEKAITEALKHFKMIGEKENADRGMLVT